jgi:uroporphyrinogen-III synthase
MAGAGTKRKEHATSPQSNHGPKVAKKQTTIEEALGGEQKQDVHEDAEMKDAPDHNGIKDLGPNGDDKNGDNDKRDVTSSSGSTGENDKDENNSGVKDATQKEKGRSEGDNQEPEATDTPGTATDNAIEKSPSREKSIASNILEKGIIYFFTRNRVGIEDSDSVGDLQRTYFVLRPTPTGAKLGDGAIPDQQNNRLFALPKKSFPKSHHDRFMAFVERAKAGVEELKEDFFKGSQYETKTAGTRQQQPVIPVGEGVYAITRTEDRSTHLAYAITIPTELGEIQEDLGLRSQGSFQISVKNPERSGPANANLPKGPEFPKEYVHPTPLAVGI